MCAWAASLGLVVVYGRVTAYSSCITVFRMRRNCGGASATCRRFLQQHQCNVRSRYTFKQQREPQPPHSNRHCSSSTTMSQQPERSKKRKLKPSKPLLEQLPVAPSEHKPAGHKHHKRQQHQQQQPHQEQEPQQEAHADALSAGNSKFARALGSTDFHTREQGLQALSRWLTHRWVTGAANRGARLLSLRRHP